MAWHPYFASLEAEDGDYSVTSARGQQHPQYRCGKNALERARIFLRLRRSLRDLFFFHFSLMLQTDVNDCDNDEGDGEGVLCL